MGTGRYKTDDNLDLLNQIAAINERLSRLERTAQLGNSTISRGSIIVDGDGSISVVGSGNIEATGGGAVRAVEPTGEEVGMLNGEFYTITGDQSGDEIPGRIFGFVFEPGSGPGVAGRMVMYIIPPHAVDEFNNFLFLEGESPASMGSFFLAAYEGSGIIEANTAILNGHASLDLMTEDLMFFNTGNQLLSESVGNTFIVADAGIAVECINPMNIEGQTISLITTDNQTFIDHTTTGSAANAFLNSTTGLLQRSTSSARYKVNIQDLDIDTAAVLRLRPRTWQDKIESEATPDGEEARQYVGLVAEEVAEHLPAFVEYDTDGLPEAISYDRLAVALLAVVQEQASQIATLTTGTPIRLARTGTVVGAQPPPRTPQRPEKLVRPERPDRPEQIDPRTKLMNSAPKTKSTNSSPRSNGKARS